MTAFQKLVIRVLIFLLKNCSYSGPVTVGQINHLVRELEEFE